MRYLLVTVVGMLLGAAVSAAEPAVSKGLVVHEWGVFRVHEDVDLANADLRAEWDELPEFIYGQIKGRVVPVNWGAAEIRRRPVVFFHAPEGALVRMRIAFPGGMPGVWWPGTSTPAAVGNRQPKVGNYLEWQLGVKQPPPNRRPRNTALSSVPRGHWIERLRAVQADEVFALFGDGPLDVDREKFVYYDGVFPQGKWLRITVQPERVALASRVQFPVFDVTVVDRRAAGKVRVGRIKELQAGAEIKSVEFVDAEPGKFAVTAAQTLVQQLTVAGLFEDEARSLADLWQTDLFETSGINVFYRLPQAEYDRRLPLTLTPAAEQLVRVGLVHHAHCEPDLAERVLKVVKQLDADDFATRQAAQKQLAEMGRAAYVHLARLRKTELPVEVRRRIDALVEKWETQKAFPE